MCGLAVLRSGAGLATVATAESALAQVAAYAPELMTDALRETASGSDCGSGDRTRKEKVLWR